MPPREEKWASAAQAVARDLQRLDPGPLAKCRRMRTPDGTPAFWRLAARYPGTIGRLDQAEQWTTLMRILAILTPKGDPSKRHDLHDPKRRFGAVLCDGGDPAWPRPRSGRPSPIISEQRLAQLTAARGSQQAVRLETAARHLAHTRSPNSGIDVTDIASTLLRPDDWKQIVGPYYDRLEQAKHATIKSEKGVS